MKYSRLEEAHDFDNGQEGSPEKTVMQRSTASTSSHALKQVCLLLAVIFPWLTTAYLLVERDHGSCRARQTPQSTLSGGFPQVLYSPAQHVVEVEFQKFQEGFGWDRSKYQGSPSPELDAAWSDLYTGIIYSRIPKAQAALLPNKTSAIPGDDGHYVVMLNVFHELHCLNMIRKKLHPEYYDVNDTELKNFLAEHHIDHCIDSIRASLMCSADISPMVWQWWEPSNRFSPRNDIVHTCRKWENIHRWAEEHAVLGPIDYSVKIEDDIVIDPF